MAACASGNVDLMRALCVPDSLTMTNLHGAGPMFFAAVAAVAADEPEHLPGALRAIRFLILKVYLRDPRW